MDLSWRVDRPLRACFRTTKYCHGWLLHAHCATLDCLYLHEVGSEEYSFTKYEVISAYTSMGARDLAIKNFIAKSATVQFTYAGFTNIIHNIHVQTTRGV
ncbi:hypothetical protein K1719_028100 [Acacia pycnantha]|nr:hypothetical protein K1719_028100 [Acacia pycnantha]